MKLILILTVYATGIRVASDSGRSLGFYRTWSDLMSFLGELKSTVVVRVYHESETVYLPR